MPVASGGGPVVTNFGTRSASGFAATTCSTVMPCLIAAVMRFCASIVAARNDATWSRFTTTPWPGRIFVFGPAMSTIICNAAIVPLTVPPFPPSTVG